MRTLAVDNCDLKKKLVFCENQSPLVDDYWKGIICAEDLHLVRTGCVRLVVVWRGPPAPSVW